MNQPTQLLSYNEQLNLERCMFDAMDSLCQALAYGLMLGWGMQAIDVKIGLVTEKAPAIIMTFPPAAPGGENRQVAFAVGRDAPTVPALLMQVGGHAHNIIMEAGSKEDGVDISDYLLRARDRQKSRDEKRKVILLPGGN